MRIALAVMVSISLLTSSRALAAEPSLPAEALEVLTFETVPGIPEPNQIFKVRVSNYSTDLGAARLSWTANGKGQGSGIGKTEIEIRAPAAGTVLRIEVVAKTEEGKTIRGALAVRPAGLDLIWEASSYTPPFYEGKALLPHQGSARLIALPRFSNKGKIYAPAELVYKWFINGTPSPAESGFGRNTFAYRGGVLLRTDIIEVQAATGDGAIKARAFTALAPVSPQLILYEDHPLQGTRDEEALPNDIDLGSPEAKVTAVPYFFETASPESGELIYRWTLNGKEAAGGKNDSTLTLRQGARGGSATLAVSVENPLRSFQLARAGAVIHFRGAESFPF